jgi:hypothetical protein
MMKEKSQEEKLDYALKQLDDNLLLWGIDNWLGYRTAETSMIYRWQVRLIWWHL